MIDAALPAYEIVKLNAGYGVARKHSEIEAVFDTRSAARAYILFEDHHLLPDSDKLAGSLDGLLVRHKRSALAKLIRSAIKNDLCSAGEKPIVNKKLLMLELARVNHRYLLAKLETLSPEELCALEVLGVTQVIHCWLNQVGRVTN